MEAAGLRPGGLRRSRQQLSRGRRPAERGRHVRTGQGGDHGDGGSPVRRVPGHERGYWDQLLPHARQHVPALPNYADGDGWRQSVPPAPDLREFGQPAAGAGERTRPRVRRACGPRCRQGTADATADHRERDALAVPLFSSLVPPTLPIPEQPALDLRVLGVAALFTVLTALGFGLFPALRAGDGTAFDALREGSRAGGGHKRRLRAVLVTVEVTMSVILLITSGLLMRAVWRVQAVHPGFATDNVLSLRTALPRPKYEDPASRRDFYQRVLREVRVLPGVRSAAYVSGLPMEMTGGMGAIQLRGQDRRGSGDLVSRRFVTSH